MKPSHNPASHRIAMVIDGWDSTWGGGQVHVQELCEQLTSRHNLSVDLFTRALPRENPESMTTPSPRWRVIRVGPQTAFFNPIGRIASIVTLWWKLSSYHRKHPYTLVHAHTYLGVIPAYIFARLHHLPLVVTIHGTNLTDQGARSLAASIEHIIVHKLSYSHTITVTQKYLTDFPNRLNTTWIPNGVDPEFFRPVHSETSPKEDAPARFIFVGRLDKVKGLDLLFHALAKQPFPYTLTIIGDGPELQPLMSLASHLKITDAISFEGYKTREAMPAYYHAADLFLLPSRSEGLPLTLLEAMACGLPVLVTNVGEIPHFLNDTNGWIATPNSVESLDFSLHAAYNNRSNWSAIGKTNRSLILQQYTWEKMADATYSLYTELTK